MIKKVMIVFTCSSIFFITPVFSQLQSCPPNINFATGDLSFWSASTGLLDSANIGSWSATHVLQYPAPNNGVSLIPEYLTPTFGALQVLTTVATDPFGGFPTIPTINGYSYNFSIKIGSTAISRDYGGPTSGPGGRTPGFVRSVTYLINVPAGPTTVPYTMTYAYAMILENGTHNSNEQPMCKATLKLVANDSIIICASPHYLLPTFGVNGNGSSGAVLDTAAALANGFTNSPIPFGNGGRLRDVWTKAWTEVTFDLSPFRGQQVSLSFEADNCVPGGHFAYEYVAVRNVCAGLQISGPLNACANNTATYSVPSLTNGTYSWSVPPSWTINSGTNSPIINVTVGNTGGTIKVNEINGCANLKDTISVSASPPTVPGAVLNNAAVCGGINSTALTLNGYTGNILNWISSTDGGTTWTPIADTTTGYTAQNLNATTEYAAVIQNGSGCKMDTSTAAIITVNPKDAGGTLHPADTVICKNQSSNILLTLTGNKGTIVNWQWSTDSITWNNFNPPDTTTTFAINNLATSTDYRVIVSGGVCPFDTSSVSKITLSNAAFPSATINPAISFICYGDSVQLNANITIGTSYTWSNANTLTNAGNGTISSEPTSISAIAIPPKTTYYVLSVNNAGCPNTLLDTFLVNVTPPIIVFAGNDTAVVANQPLQLNATVNDPAANIWNWTPGTGLSSTIIPDPVAILTTSMGDSIVYTVRATDPSLGCHGQASIRVTIFKTGPQIFVPNGFTPNGDGLNDIIRPICVGIKQLNYFRIYNRWGQMVYSTNKLGEGWNGIFNGVRQPSDNFVYTVEGIDYLGHLHFGKGNVILIR